MFKKKLKEAMFRKIINVFILLSGIFVINNSKANENVTINMLLEKGLVVIETYPEKAPLTVKRITELVKEGFYDGLTFHRVISGFMAQGGDPEGNGMRKWKKILKQNLMILNILEELFQWQEVMIQILLIVSFLFVTTLIVF